MKPPVGRSVAAVFAAVYLFSNGVFVHAAETNFWAERSKVSRARQSGTLQASASAVRQAYSLTPLALHPVSSALTSDIKSTLSPPFIEKHKELFELLNPAHGTMRRVSFPAPGGSPSPLILHIQDVHMNEDAQKNISRVVHSLTTRGVATTVALEGAWGDINLTPFQTFPHRQAVTMAADYLLKTNEISGPVYAGMVGNGRYVGIDDKDHYTAHVDAYKQSAPRQDLIKARLADEAQSLTQKKARVFTGALLQLDQTVERYRTGAVRLGDYVETMAQSSGLSETRSSNAPIHKFLTALRYERTIDFKQVEKERKVVIEKLIERLTEQEISRLTAESNAYRSGQVRYGDFYGSLRDLCQRSGIRLSAFPAMDEYINYVLAADGINVENLLEEITILERRAFEFLATTPEQRRLVDESRRLFLTQKLVDFGLTPTEWREYRERQPPPADQASLLKSLDLNSFEDFYRQADARDGAMARSTMEVASSSVTLLVTGGFHAEGMAKHLTEAGATVISWVPKIENLDTTQGSAYLSVFNQEKTPLEKLMQGEKLFLAKEPISSTTLKVRAGVSTVIAALSLAGNALGVDPQALYSSLGCVGVLSVANEFIRGQYKARVVVGDHGFDYSGSVGQGMIQDFSEVPSLSKTRTYSRHYFPTLIGLVFVGATGLAPPWLLFGVGIIVFRMERQKGGVKLSWGGRGFLLAVRAVPEALFHFIDRAYERTFLNTQPHGKEPLVTKPAYRWQIAREALYFLTLGAGAIVGHGLAVFLGMTGDGLSIFQLIGAMGGVSLGGTALFRRHTENARALLYRLGIIRSPENYRWDVALVLATTAVGALLIFSGISLTGTAAGMHFGYMEILSASLVAVLTAGFIIHPRLNLAMISRGRAHGMADLPPERSHKSLPVDEFQGYVPNFEIVSFPIDITLGVSMGKEVQEILILTSNYLSDVTQLYFPGSIDLNTPYQDHIGRYKSPGLWNQETRNKHNELKTRFINSVLSLPAEARQLILGPDSLPVGEIDPDRFLLLSLRRYLALYGILVQSESALIPDPNSGEIIDTVHFLTFFQVKKMEKETREVWGRPVSAQVVVPGDRLRLEGMAPLPLVPLGKEYASNGVIVISPDAIQKKAQLFQQYLNISAQLPNTRLGNSAPIYRFFEGFSRKSIPPAIALTMECIRRLKDEKGGGNFSDAVLMADLDHERAHIAQSSYRYIPAPHREIGSSLRPFLEQESEAKTNREIDARLYSLRNNPLIVIALEMIPEMDAPDKVQPPYRGNYTRILAEIKTVVKNNLSAYGVQSVKDHPGLLPHFTWMAILLRISENKSLWASLIDEVHRNLVRELNPGGVGTDPTASHIPPRPEARENLERTYATFGPDLEKRELDLSTTGDALVAAQFVAGNELTEELFPGGNDLTRELESVVAGVRNIIVTGGLIPEDYVDLYDRAVFHSSLHVFRRVSNEQANEEQIDLAESATKKAAEGVDAWNLVFERVVINNNTLVALGFVDGETAGLSAVRDRVAERVDDGLEKKRTRIIGISLGRFKKSLPPEILQEIQGYLASRNPKGILLGKIIVNKIVVFSHRGPNFHETPLIVRRVINLRAQGPISNQSPILAVDIGGTGIAVAVVGAKGDIIAHEKQATPRVNPETFFRQVAELILRVRQQAETKGHTVSNRVGVGAPGRYIPGEGGRMVVAPGSAPQMGEKPGQFDGICPQALLEQHLPGMTVAVNNDAVAQFASQLNRLLQAPVGQSLHTAKVAYVGPGTSLGGGFAEVGRDGQMNFRTDGHIFDLVVERGMILEGKAGDRGFRLPTSGIAMDVFSGNGIAGLMQGVDTALENEGGSPVFSHLGVPNGRLLNQLLANEIGDRAVHGAAEEVARFVGESLGRIMEKIFLGEIEKATPNAEWSEEDKGFVRGTTRFLLGGSVPQGKLGEIIQEQALKYLKAKQSDVKFTILRSAAASKEAGLEGAAILARMEGKNNEGQSPPAQTPLTRWVWNHLRPVLPMAWRDSVKAEARFTAGWEFAVHWLAPFILTYWAAVGAILLGVPLSPELVTTLSTPLWGKVFQLAHGQRAPPEWFNYLLTVTYGFAALYWFTGDAFLGVLMAVLGWGGHGLFDQRALSNEKASVILRNVDSHPLVLDVNSIDRLVLTHSDAKSRRVAIDGKGSVLVFADKKNFLTNEARANMARLMRINPNILLVTDGTDVQIPEISPERVLAIPEAFTVPGGRVPPVGREGVYLERVLRSESINTIWNQGTVSFYHSSNIELLLPAGADTRLTNAVNNAWVLLDLFRSMLPASKVRWKEVDKVLRSIARAA